MDRETPISIQEIKGKDNKSTCTFLPKREDKFRVEIDISEHAIGGVLSQE